MDSYCVLTNSLSKLARDFEVETQKGDFPYKFSKEMHLFYKGHTPGIHFYNNISIEKYKDMYTENWSFKDESIRYLKDDLNCLYEVIVKANNQIFADYKINMTEAITISGLAIKLYLNKFYNNNIPRISKPSIYRDIQTSTTPPKEIFNVKSKYLSQLNVCLKTLMCTCNLVLSLRNGW